MKRDQLESSLTAIGVHPSSFSIGSIQHGECDCAIPESGQWKVLYVERDKPKAMGLFPTEEDAYDFIYATFCKWMNIQSS